MFSKKKIREQGDINVWKEWINGSCYYILFVIVRKEDGLEIEQAWAMSLWQVEKYIHALPVTTTIYAETFQHKIKQEW